MSMSHLTDAVKAEILALHQIRSRVYNGSKYGLGFRQAILRLRSLGDTLAIHLSVDARFSRLCSGFDSTRASKLVLSELTLFFVWQLFRYCYMLYIMCYIPHNTRRGVRWPSVKPRAHQLYLYSLVYGYTQTLFKPDRFATASS